MSTCRCVIDLSPDKYLDNMILYMSIPYSFALKLKYKLHLSHSRWSLLLMKTDELIVRLLPAWSQSFFQLRTLHMS